MRTVAALFIPALALAQYVSAHGFLSQVAVDGNWYAGNIPNNYKGPSPIRLVDDIGPVKGASNPDLACGLSAQNGATVIPANPGSVITFQWSGGGGGKWPHNTGPLMTYMASCGSTSCDKFNASGAQWFKIDQKGLKPDGSTWYQADISQGDAFSVTLPDTVSPGGYLIRHEIIALHLAMTVGGAEFYPTCTQVQIGGSGSGKPQSTVSFPGAYSDTDPGIYDPNVYNPGSNYTFPGGPLSNLAASSDSIDPPASMSASFVSSPSASAPTASAAAAGSVGSGIPSSAASAMPSAAEARCSLVAPSNNVNKPRHFSRIMRRILDLSF